MKVIPTLERKLLEDILGGREVEGHLITGGHRRTAEVLSYLQRAGVSVQLLDSHNWSNRGSTLREFLPRNLWYLSQFFKMPRGKDVILLEDYTRRFHLLLANLLVRSTRKAKLVGWVQEFAFNYRDSFVKNSIDKLVSIFFLKTMDIVFTGSQGAAKEVMRLGVPAHKLQVIRPALRELFINSTPSPRVKEENQTISLLFVAARLHPTKGLEYLLEAIRELHHHNLKLTVVGESSFPFPQYGKQIFSLVERLDIAQRVNFIGEVKEVKALMKIYQNSDIFVQPSLWDTSPIPIVEAMCLQLPVVATNVGGIPEFVEDGVTGILVPPKDPQALAEAISALAQNPQLRKEMGRRGYEKSLSFRQRAWEDVGREYYQAFLKLVR